MFKFWGFGFLVPLCGVPSGLYGELCLVVSVCVFAKVFMVDVCVLRCFCEFIFVVLDGSRRVGMFIVRLFSFCPMIIMVVARCCVLVNLSVMPTSKRWGVSGGLGQPLRAQEYLGALGGSATPSLGLMWGVVHYAWFCDGGRGLSIVLVGVRV